MKITQKIIDETISNCKWRSENRGPEKIIPGICVGYCLPCERVIDKGQCDTLRELLRRVKNGNDD